MALRFKGLWRFNPPEDNRFLNRSIPNSAVEEFNTVILKVAMQGNRWDILEHFKRHYAAVIGTMSVRSSSESWAETDLRSYMDGAKDNAPLFIETFYDACENIRRRSPDQFVPDAEFINTVLQKHDIGFEIRPPDLVLRDEVAPLISVPERPPTLKERAVDVLQASLNRSEQLLAEGRPREAVQEILWLLETVTTAFRGLDTVSGTVEGKYFNQIARDLRAKHAGNTLVRVLEWVTSIHGYLSSPTGGAVRHGVDLNEGVELDPNEARLFCNLIRSFLSFLLTEHERLSKYAE